MLLLCWPAILLHPFTEYTVQWGPARSAAHTVAAHEMQASGISQMLLLILETPAPAHPKSLIEKATSVFGHNRAHSLLHVMAG